ncbi:adenylyltransferase/cytidyltransferase family protein [Arthrobacter sp. TMN-50]
MAYDTTGKQDVQGIRIGYAAGAFDLFHVGHLNILRQAKSRCDFLIAGVVSDDILAETKGHRPVIPLTERMEIVENIGLVDRVCAETVPDRMAVWDQLRFNIFFKGDDWKGTERARRLEEQFAARNVAVVYFPYTVHTSSTALRLALENLNLNRDRHEYPLLNGTN